MSYGSSWTVFDGFLPFTLPEQEINEALKSENKIKGFFGMADQKSQNSESIIENNHISNEDSMSSNLNANNNENSSSD
jgi:hypothetical protein